MNITNPSCGTCKKMEWALCDTTYGDPEAHSAERVTVLHSPVARPYPICYRSYNRRNVSDQEAAKEIDDACLFRRDSCCNRGQDVRKRSCEYSTRTRTQE